MLKVSESAYNDIGIIILCKSHYAKLVDVIELTAIGTASPDSEECECCENDTLDDYMAEYARQMGAMAS